MGAPKVYRFDDDGAPVLTSADNTKLIALLKACLVDGYGDKQPAGWTMPHIDAAGTSAAFRNNPTTGTGFFLRVSPNGTNKHQYVMRAYESMTSATEGTLPFYPESTTLFFTVSQSSGQSIARPWLVVADDRLFYLTIWGDTTVAQFSSSNLTMFGMVFGDGIQWIESDNYFCVLSLSSNNAGMEILGADADIGSGVHYVARNVAGDVSDNAQCAFIHGGGPCLTTDKGYRVRQYAADRIVGSEIMSRPYVNQGAPYTFRGYLPGLWLPCNKGTDFSMLEQIEMDGHRFIVCRGGTTTGNRPADYIQAFDVSEHFRP